MVFPLWAIVMGRGFGGVWTAWAGRRWLRTGWLVLLVTQVYGVLAFHPFGLSYYNALAGGLVGAERLGLELTYWGDAVDRILLGRLERLAAPGDTAARWRRPCIPVRVSFTTTRGLLRRRIVLKDDDAVGRTDLAGRLTPVGLLEPRAPHSSRPARSCCDTQPPGSLALGPLGVSIGRINRVATPFTETSSSPWSRGRQFVKYVQNDLNEPTEA